MQLRKPLLAKQLRAKQQLLKKLQRVKPPALKKQLHVKPLLRKLLDVSLLLQVVPASAQPVVPAARRKTMPTTRCNSITKAAWAEKAAKNKLPKLLRY